MSTTMKTLPRFTAHSDDHRGYVVYDNIARKVVGIFSGPDARRAAVYDAKSRCASNKARNESRRGRRR